MSQPEENTNPEFILPIICPHCNKEMDLSMMFALLKPEPKTETPKVDDGEEEEITP